MFRIRWIPLATVALLVGCGGGGGKHRTPSRAFTRAVRFTNPNHSIQLTGGPLNGGVDLSDGDFTVEAIVRPVSSTGYREIWQQWRVNESNQVLRLQDGEVWAINAGTGITEQRFLGGFLPPDLWHHVAWVKDAAGVRVYVDGQRVVSNAGGPFPTTVPMAAALGRNVGVSNSDDQPAFLGDLAAFRISNTARYTGATYVVRSQRWSSDVFTRVLFDPSSTVGSPTTIEMEGSQGLIGMVGGGAGATPPSFVAYTP